MISEDFARFLFKEEWRVVGEEEIDATETELNQPDSSVNSEAENTAVKRKRRKGELVDKRLWKRQVNAIRREKGEAYVSRSRQRIEDEQEMKAEYVDVTRQPKAMGPRCECKRQHLDCREVNEEIRESIFRKYWSLPWQEKRSYVCKLMDLCKVKRPRNRKHPEVSRRSTTFKYTFEHEGSVYNVCKVMFSNTLDVNLGTLQTWKKKQVGQPNSTTVWSEIRNDKRKVEASQAQLTASLNETQMELHVATTKRKRDECEECAKYQKQEISEEDYEHHLMKVEDAKKAKMADTNDPAIEVFAVNLQSTLLAPQNNSVKHSRTKLIVHNFTVYNLKTGKGYCFLWNEVEGNLNSNVFASIYYYFIQVYVMSNLAGREIVFYSDGCNCQNRNNVLTKALINCALEHGIVITQKYTEPGHAELECDEMHADIEAALRHRNINVPADYIAVCEQARLENPYIVIYLSFPFFKNFERVKYLKSLKPGANKVEDVRCLRYDGKNGTVSFKLSHSARREYEDLPTKGTKVNFIAFGDLPTLFVNQLSITVTKWNHLQELKFSIPKDYHSFYDNLPTE